MKNENLLKSEVALVAYGLEKSGRTLSVGCGSGLFEYFLKKDYDIDIVEGFEPSISMADIAVKRGINVTIGKVEESDLGIEKYDTILFNGTPSYISDLESAFAKAYFALNSTGKIVVIDVPKEGSFAMLYNLAMTVGTWEHELLKGIQPSFVYPIEFVQEANWRTTGEKVDILKKVGFSDFQFAQTLTKHPLYANNEFEKPQEGYDKGDYVAIIAKK